MAAHGKMMIVDNEWLHFSAHVLGVSDRRACSESHGKGGSTVENDTKQCCSNLHARGCANLFKKGFCFVTLEEALIAKGCRNKQT